MSRKLVIFLLLLLQCTARAFAQFNIWEGTALRQHVECTPFLAPGHDNMAVIVCPGGSYFWHDMETEGFEVARWLQRNGVSAFVLKYRTAQFPAYFTHYRLIFRGIRYPDAQDDLLQTIRYVKAHAADYGIDTRRIGVMGFSAGGHLVMSGAEHFAEADRPAFVAPIYPVVTMVEKCVHKRSRRALMGDSRVHNKALRDSLSLERHVPQDCPPVFLVNCHDDPIVHYHNAELLDSALTAKGITHQYIQYPTGGHGFGASETKGSAECRQWKNEFLAWVRQLTFTKEE